MILSYADLESLGRTAAELFTQQALEATEKVHAALSGIVVSGGLKGKLRLFVHNPGPQVRCTANPPTDRNSPDLIPK